jgi:hypothetical protein
MIMPELLALLGGGPSEAGGAAGRTPQDYINALQRASEECARRGGSQMERLMCVLAGVVGAPLSSGGGNTTVPSDVERAAKEFAEQWRRLSEMCDGRGDPISRLVCILGGMQSKGVSGAGEGKPGAPQDGEFRMLRLLGILP